MQPAAKNEISPGDVLTQAVGNAARALGLSRQDLGQVIGRDRTSISRGIDPEMFIIMNQSIG